MSDLVTFGDTAVQFTPSGHERLATARETELYADGIESGAAVAASALGGNPTWVSQLPDSPLGRQVAGQLRQHGIETDVTWADPDETRQSLVFRERGRSPREDVVRHDRDRAPLASASPGDLPMNLIQGAEALLVGGSTAALSDQAGTTTGALLRAAHGSGVTTAFDLHYQPGYRSADRYREVLLDLVDHLDVLIANEDDVRTVLDESGQSREIANIVAAEYDLEMVVITRSAWGAVALHDTPGTNVMHERETAETEPVDPAGQHAAFAGALLQQLIDGADLADALSYGVATATFARTVPGPLLTADRDEIDRVVDDVVDDSR